MLFDYSCLLSQQLKFLCLIVILNVKHIIAPTLMFVTNCFKKIHDSQHSLQLI